MSRTKLEKIASIEETMRQLDNQRKQLLQQQKEADRKVRTKRLIERGAILESLISNPTDYTNDQIKAFLEKTIATDYARKILDSLTRQDSETVTPEAPWTKRTTTTTPNDKSRETAQGTS